MDMNAARKQELNGGILQSLFEKVIRAEKPKSNLAMLPGKAIYADPLVQSMFAGFLLGVVCYQEGVLSPDDLEVEEQQVNS
jgi:hypothetical protein